MTGKGIASVCVYCGAQPAIDPIYLKLAHDLGRALAESDITIVYGGGGTGMMGALADGALQQNGRVIGIVPRNIAKLEALHKDVTDLRMVDTMHARKLAMFDVADAVVVLPGGIGTLDEFFEVLTWKQLGIHTKPIVLLNAEGYWDSLLSLLDVLTAKNFARPATRGLMAVARDVVGVLAALRPKANAAL